MKQNIEKANQSVNKVKDDIRNHHWRLRYHVSPQAYWMNDPNGFTYFKGEYHVLPAPPVFA